MQAAFPARLVVAEAVHQSVAASGYTHRESQLCTQILDNLLSACTTTDELLRIAKPWLTRWEHLSLALFLSRSIAEPQEVQPQVEEIADELAGE
jgi:secreted Zn-dependent insulinase-like peptidase